MQTTLEKLPRQKPPVSPPPTFDRRRTASPPPAPQREGGVEGRVPPGGELHPIVYRSLLASPIIIALASWLAFGRNEGTDVDLFVMTMVYATFVVIPTLIYLASRGRRRRQSVGEFAESRIETGSGPVTGRQAWIEIALVPMALALAAILFGVASAVAG
jgi:hypothetical protein